MSEEKKTLKELEETIKPFAKKRLRIKRNSDNWQSDMDWTLIWSGSMK
ncbi:unnamed protein product [marine sediment metagenome]|uniref:Uncharacterized protein n=1 Tax=marine sediment metagenome TaxID=412755 RepID=X0UGX3_9ZZZZ